MIKAFDHVGIAVDSIDEYIGFFKNTLGLSFIGIENVPSQKVNTASLVIQGTKIEILEPDGEGSPISNFLTKRGGGLHHIAFETDDIFMELNSLRARGIKMIDDTPKNGDSGKYRNAFIHPTATGGILVELIEKNV